MNYQMLEDYSNLPESERQRVLQDSDLQAEQRDMLSAFNGMNATEQAKTLSFGRPDAPVTQVEQEQDESIAGMLWRTATLGGAILPETRMALGQDVTQEDIDEWNVGASDARNRMMRYIIPAATMGAASGISGAYQLGSKATLALEALVSGATEVGLQKAGISEGETGSVVGAAVAPGIGRGLVAGAQGLWARLGQWTGARPFLHDAFIRLGGDKLARLTKGNEDQLWDEAKRVNPNISIQKVWDTYADLATDLGRRAGAYGPLKKLDTLMKTLTKEADEGATVVGLRQVDAGLRQAREFVDQLAKGGGQGYGALVTLKKGIETSLDDAASTFADDGAKLLMAARSASKFNAGLKQLEEMWAKSRTPIPGGGAKANVQKFLKDVYLNQDELAAKLGVETLDNFTTWASQTGARLPNVVKYKSVWEYLKQHPIFAGIITGGGFVAGGAPGSAVALTTILGARVVGERVGRRLGPRIANSALRGAALTGPVQEFMAFLSQAARIMGTEGLAREDQPPRTPEDIEEVFGLSP